MRPPRGPDTSRRAAGPATTAATIGATVGIKIFYCPSAFGRHRQLGSLDNPAVHDVQRRRQYNRT